MSIKQYTQWGINVLDEILPYDDEQDARDHLHLFPHGQLVTRLVVTHSWTPVPAGLVRARS